jgi:ATP-dependent RNA helicase DDX3X
MNWKNFWEEDLKLLSEHVENSKKKESKIYFLIIFLDFDISFLENTKLNVFHNGRELSTETEQKKFADIGVNSKLKDNLDRMGFDTMTPIQKIVVPYLMDKKDVMGCAQTGSGKTVAFLAPIINNMLLEGPPKSDVDLPYGISAPIALILAPTRELSEQIYKEGRKLLHKTGILAVKVYGGVPIDTQIKFVTNGCDILVATPGRLIDFIKRGIVSLKSVKFLVFDEADRMLDMGFEDQLREIIFSSDIKSKDQRVNMMFSATFTPQVREIAKSFMNEFYFVTSNLDQANNANDNIEQTFIYSDERDKVLKLHEILQKIKGSVISKYNI